MLPLRHSRAERLLWFTARSRFFPLKRSVPRAGNATELAVSAGSDDGHASRCASCCSEQQSDQQSEHKSADVGPPCDTAGFATTCSEGPLKQLDQKPDAEEHGRWYDHQVQEEDNRNQGDDICVRVQNQVGAHDRGHCTAGTNRRDRGTRFKGIMAEAGKGSAGEVEAEIRQVSKPIFDVVPEDPEKPDVSNKVQKAAVEENAGAESGPDRKW